MFQGTLDGTLLVRTPYRPDQNPSADLKRQFQQMEAADFAEAGELKGNILAAAQRIIYEKGVSGGNAGRFSANCAP